MSKKFFNEKAKDWDNIVQHDSEKIKEVISNIEIDNSPDILDVGSGTGVLIPYLINKFGNTSKITAVDFAENMITVSREKHKQYKNIDYLVGDIYSLQLAKNTYDLILCYSVFPHFTDKVGILKKFKYCLKDNGIVIIFHSQSREAINNLHKTAGAEVERDNLPSGVEVANMAKEIGYEVVQVIDNDQLYVVKIRRNT